MPPTTWRQSTQDNECLPRREAANKCQLKAGSRQQCLPMSSKAGSRLIFDWMQQLKPRDNVKAGCRQQMSSKAGSRQQAMIRHMMKTIQDNVKAGRRQHYYDNVKAGRRQHYYDNDRHMKSFLVGDVPFAMQKCASPYMHSAAQSTLWSDSSSGSGYTMTPKLSPALSKH